MPSPGVRSSGGSIVCWRAIWRQGSEAKRGVFFVFLFVFFFVCLDVVVFLFFVVFFLFGCFCFFFVCLFGFSFFLFECVFLFGLFFFVWMCFFVWVLFVWIFFCVFYHVFKKCSRIGHRKQQITLMLEIIMNKAWCCWF